MLKFYLTTVVIWMIIIWAMVQICEPAIREKGWIKEDKSTKKGRLSILFTLAAVPIIRVFVCIIIFFMSGYTPEQWQEMRDKKDE